MNKIIKILLKSYYTQAFSFAFLFSYFDLNIPNEAEPIMHFSFGILSLALVALSCFTNVIGYLSSILLVKHYNLANKYPKLSKFLSLFEKTSLVWIIMEAVLGYICFTLIILFSLYILGEPFFK
jgi:hypothetical protein